MSIAIPFLGSYVRNVTFSYTLKRSRGRQRYYLHAVIDTVSPTPCGVRKYKKLPCCWTEKVGWMWRGAGEQLAGWLEHVDGHIWSCVVNHVTRILDIDSHIMVMIMLF